MTLLPAVLQSAPRKHTVVLGVCGSIAAYRAADLASKLVQAGHTVYPILTRSGARFLQPATLSALTGNACPVDVFDESVPNDIAHIWLAQHCDLVAIVPASMDTIAKLAHGLADDMLTSVVHATEAPVLLAPSMNTAMWNNAATQHNVSVLKSRGAIVAEPAQGRLACGTTGSGKLPETDEILRAIERALSPRKDLQGKRVVVTAGPTREYIDSVRYISNRSSGKMGFAIADEAARRGAAVTLITGPTDQQTSGGVQRIDVVSAADMFGIASRQDWDFFVAAAAVADYAPTSRNTGKLKKSSEFLELSLRPTADIVAELGRAKKEGQTVIQFCAEADNLLEHAMDKLERKNSDWIVANDITQEGAGFDVDTNSVTILGRSGQRVESGTLTKRHVAELIWDTVLGSV